ncbi:hypothetical protein OTERR_18970 [Oryzomicrobium terrae]|uniref:Ice-binding protein C-terminal domain-containing protein n=1 Tax=Oryzomicrobium terrae TaxID=1735038 RepID=A0A5C1E921_9RHOO|nr:FxDxF family PEP-CTERM protein [Oryzomicrobium terrae]QEL65373.1 hypothetical protein OTERR_18970 [Oryzomicrobium terrae]
MFKKLVLAGIISAACTTAAFAATGQTYTTSVSPGSPIVYNFNHAGESGSFFDTLNFNLTGTGIAASAVSIQLGNGGSIFGISNLTGTLWDNFHPLGNFTYGTFPGNNGTFTFNLPGSGQYHIDFTGDITGAAGGSYLVSVAAVPEPAEWLMMLGGLGMLGVVARRRLRLNSGFAAMPV